MLRRMDSSRFAVLKPFLDHWRSLAGEDKVPHLRTFLDRPEPRFQPNVSILDVTKSGVFRVRLVGTQRVDMYGVDLAEVDPLRVYTPDLRSGIVEVALTVITHPVGYAALRTMETAHGASCDAAALSLPLRLDTPDMDCVVHYHVLIDSIGYDDVAHRITDVQEGTWVDLGNGIPDKPPPFASK